MAPGSEEGTETLYLDYPSRVPAPETPAVVFMFDDGNETDYTEGLPALARYGYPAISYVNTGTVGSDGNLDEGQLAQLASEGWLCGSHTPEHTNLRDVGSTEELAELLRTSKEWLTERGYEAGARHFAYPYGGVDRQALRVVSRFHDTGRAGGWQPVALPSNTQLIPGGGDLSVSEVRPLLDWTVRYGGVLSLFFHGLNTRAQVEGFRDVVDEVHRRDRAGEVDVLRVDELAELATAVREQV